MHDLAIAGAGPAGASAARAAARAGLSVLLFDKDRFPRPKPCGGALSEHAVKALDFPLPDDLIERDYHGGLLCIDARRTLAAPPWRTGVLVTRERFDALLVDKAREAGAEVREGVKVLGFAEDGEGVRLRTSAGEARARLLLVCEGASGRLKHAVRPPDSPHEYNYCVCADVPNAPDSAPGAAVSGKPLVLHFGICRVSYGWVFPRRTDSSVGMGELGTERRKAVAHLMELLRAHGVERPVRLQGHKIPMGGVDRPVYRGRALLAGDAGGFADPLLGEGISHAIRTGQMAAKAVAEALAAGDPLAAGPLFEQLTRPLHEELRHALRLVRALEHAPRHLYKAMLSDKKTVLRYVDILAGRCTYREFNRYLKRRMPWYLLRMLWA
ncbi:geranylgeranyl reductase [Desulfovibrio sp. X2]|uniref:geranylgeranyl reductase family protein n=1 Tax=Desulfovibrio sp. X2 TaxID=941449 RepID=UPI0003587CA9|nr:geranylgeranyl reductase family protein [Desulfovibrio sp. X2]EPR39786.1 geranylgeranyl reductase [Desulfovibrio sp. X2]